MSSSNHLTPTCTFAEILCASKRDRRFLCGFADHASLLLARDSRTAMPSRCRSNSIALLGRFVSKEDWSAIPHPSLAKRQLHCALGLRSRTQGAAPSGTTIWFCLVMHPL